MKRNLRIGYAIIFATVLLVNLAIISVSATENKSTVENNSLDIPEFENWAKPMNLSEYDGHKPQIKIEPLSPEALEKANPGVIALNESEKKELNRISRKDTLFEINFEPDGQVSIASLLKSKDLSEHEKEAKSDSDVRITKIKLRAATPP